MSNPFVFRLLPPRPDFPVTMSEEERVVMHDHGTYWSDLAARGAAVAFGPVDDPAGAYGIGIVLAEGRDAAEKIRDGDPVVRCGVGFRVQIAPMRQLVTPGGRYPGA